MPREDYRRRMTLDVVRGIAILLVLGFHLRMPTGAASFDAIVAPIFAVGWVGVDLFFVLSGFLIGRIILTAVATPTGLDRRAFFARRVLRLWPVLFVYLATMMLISGADSWRSIWPVLLHIQNYDDRAPSHLWSLAVEEHFYLLMVMVLPAVMRAGGHRAIERLLIATMVACLLLRLAALEWGEPLLHLQWQTQYRLDSLAFGVLMASIARHRPSLYVALSRHRAALIGIALGGYSVLAVFGDGAFRHGPGFTIAYLSSGALILALEDCRIPRLLLHPARCLAWLGLIAYPLYIWHASIAAVARPLLPFFGVPQGAIAPLAAVICIMVGASISSLVERPMMKLARRHPRRPYSGGAPAPA